MNKFQISERFLVLLAVGGIGFGVAGCGGDEDGGGEGGGKAELEERHREDFLAVAPKSAAEALEKVKAAAASVLAAEGMEATDEAAYRAEGEIEAAAAYLLDVEAGKISDLAVQARFRGSVQNLKLLGVKLHDLAHAGADAKVVGRVAKLIEVEILQIGRYLTS